MTYNNSLQDPIPITGDSYSDCLERLKRLFGDNYQIVSKRTYRPSGLFSLFQKKQYEMMYIPLHTEIRRAQQSYSPSSQLDFREERTKILDANQTTQNPQMKLILDEIKDLHSKFDEKTATLRQDDHASIITIMNMMKSNEFTDGYITKIIDKIRKEFSLEGLDDFAAVESKVVDWIGETIQIGETHTAARPEIVVLVGPTGIGKTTTVAKLAAYFNGIGNPNLSQGLKVALITTDGIRIGAKEQLETYGELMGIPVSFASNEEDLQQLLNFYGRDTDVIIVDTAGHSPKDYESLLKMRQILEFKSRKPQVYLTISAPTKSNDLRTILQQYEIFGYNSVIVTKVDETENVGPIISILDEKKKNMAYITDGQKVPRNFKKADPVSFLINLTGFNVDRNHIDEKFIQEK